MPQQPAFDELRIEAGAREQVPLTVGTDHRVAVAVADG